MSILNETGAMDLGLSSVKDNDELGVLRSIDFLTERGTEYIKKRLELDAKKAVISIRDIGSAAVLQKMEIGVFLSLFSLGKMAEAAREKKMHDTGFSILHSLCAIGKAAVGQKMETAVRIAVCIPGGNSKCCVSSENGKRSSSCGSGYRVHRRRNLQAAKYQSSRKRRTFNPNFNCILITTPGKGGNYSF